MAWCTEGRIHVVAHNHLQPTTLEWERYLNEARENQGVAGLVVLVHSAGGSPDAKQRKAMAHMAHQHYPNPPAQVILTSSIVVRAVMKLATMFNPKIRCFPPEHFNLACTYLGLSREERDRTAELLQQTQAQLTG